MDPAAIIATSSISSVIAETIFRQVFRCMLSAAKSSSALVLIIGKTELCKKLYNLNDDNFYCVDVEGETWASLTDATKTTLQDLQTKGNLAQRDRLFNLYAKAYVTALKRNFQKAQFLFVTSSHQLAKYACGVPQSRIQTALPSGTFAEVLLKDKDQLTAADFESKKVESLRACRNERLYVFDSWDTLTSEIMRQYKLSPRL